MHLITLHTVPTVLWKIKAFTGPQTQDAATEDESEERGGAGFLTVIKILQTRHSLVVTADMPCESGC